MFMRMRGCCVRMLGWGDMGEGSMETERRGETEAGLALRVFSRPPVFFSFALSRSSATVWLVFMGGLFILVLLCDEGSGGALVHIDFLGEGGRIITHLIGVGKAGMGGFFFVHYWLVGWSIPFLCGELPMCECVCKHEVLFSSNRKV